MADSIPLWSGSGSALLGGGVGGTLHANALHAKRMYIYEKASFLLGGAEPADALVVECVIGPRML